MKRFTVCLLLFVVLPSLAAGQDTGVVKVTGQRGGQPIEGSGFVVAVEGDVASIVTAAHVVAGTSPLEVTFAAVSQERFRVERVHAMDPDVDLAVFRVRGVPAGVSVLALDSESRPRPAERLLLAGFQQRLATPLTKERIVAGRNGFTLLVDQTVGKGFSGGPVLYGGKVVAMVKDEDAQLTYAVTAVLLREALLGWGVTPCVRDEVTENGIVFVRICEGRFMMGSPDDDPLADDDEKPAHEESVEEFWIGKTEVTNAQYRAFKPKHEGEANLPATGVTWNDAKAFCERYGYRLPTEAEWEYATRAGTTTPWSFPEGKIDRYAWYSGNSDRKVHPVGKKEPNPWGLHDMHGNVWEWVADVYGPYGGKETSADATSALRVVRGGSFWDGRGWLRSANRKGFVPVFGYVYLGFRCVRGPRPQP